MGHKQPQPCSTGCCGSGCPEHGNIRPDVTCRRFEESGSDKFFFSVTRADEVYVTRSCPGEDDVVVDYTESLVDGAFSTTLILIGASECVISVTAINGCGSRTCYSDCPDITLTLDVSLSLIDPGDKPCDRPIWVIDWEYSIPAFSGSELAFGVVQLFQDGNTVETINLEPGLFSDSGTIEIDPCEFVVQQAEVVRFYLQTECGKFAEDWRYIPICHWLANKVELEITGVADVDDTCFEEGDGETLVISVERTITTTGLSALNDTWEFDITCTDTSLNFGALVGENYEVGPITIEYTRETISGVGGSPDFSSLEEVTFEGTIYLVADQCQRASVREKDFTPSDLQAGIRIALVGTKTVHSVVTNLNTMAVVSESTSSSECDGSFEDGTTWSCFNILPDNIVSGQCFIDESATDVSRPLLTASLTWGDPSGMFLLSIPETVALCNNSEIPLLGASMRLRYRPKHPGLA